MTDDLIWAWTRTSWDGNRPTWDYLWSDEKPDHVADADNSDPTEYFLLDGPTMQAAIAAAEARGMRMAAELVLDWQGLVAIGTTQGNAAHDAALSRIYHYILACQCGG